MQRHAVLRQPGRVHQGALCAVDVVVKLVNQRAFMVGLKNLQRNVQFFGQRLQAGIDFSQRGGAVNMRLAAAK